MGRNRLVGLGFMEEGCDAESSSVLMLSKSMVFEWGVLVLVVLACGGGMRFGDLTEMCVGGLVSCSWLVLLIRLSSAWGFRRVCVSICSSGLKV